MGVTAVGLLGLTLLGFQTSLYVIVSDLLIIGFGFGLFSSPNMNAIMSSVDRKSYGIASGVVGSMRMLGQMFSMGIATLAFSLTMGRTPITPKLYPAFFEERRCGLHGMCGALYSGNFCFSGERKIER